MLLAQERNHLTTFPAFDWPYIGGLASSAQIGLGTKNWKAQPHSRGKLDPKSPVSGLPGLQSPFCIYISQVIKAYSGQPLVLVLGDPCTVLVPQYLSQMPNGQMANDKWLATCAKKTLRAAWGILALAQPRLFGR